MYKPRGAYYIMTDISGFGFDSSKRAPDSANIGGGKTTKDVVFAKFLVQTVGIAVVPGSSFYRNPEDGSTQVRFTFCKKESTLAAAEERFARLQHLLAQHARA